MINKNYRFTVQEKKKIRIIIDSDAACEADDQFAIVHALLTPRFKVEGIIAEQFNSEGGWEFNLKNDYHAANVVFKSQVELWQVPMEAYTTMQTGYAELQQKVLPCGQIGKYLFEQMIALGMEKDWIMGESWSLGDSPAVGLALNPGCGQYRLQRAPVVDSDGYYYEEEGNREIRVYYRLDSRYILEDFFAKLQICYANINTQTSK